MNSSKLSQALTLAKELGVLTPKDLESQGIPRQYLHRLEQEGLLNRTSRGIYTCVQGDITEYHSYVEVCKRVPNGVLCLASALRFHELTTQSPLAVSRTKLDSLHKQTICVAPQATQTKAVQFCLGSLDPWQVWLAIEHKARRPKLEYPSLRLFYMSGEAFTCGVEEHQIEGAMVRVFSVAKTVVDCFKFRNKIGIDVAVEAQKEYWFERRGTIDELGHYADICRVRNVFCAPTCKCFKKPKTVQVCQNLLSPLNPNSRRRCRSTHESDFCLR